jgi:hypothetical protein
MPIMSGNLDLPRVAILRFPARNGAIHIQGEFKIFTVSQAGKRGKPGIV